MVAQLQSVSAARQAILEMLETVSTSPTFTGASLDHDSMSLLVCEREGEGRAAQSRVVVEMKVVGKMTNQLGNMHGGCCATLVDNITSMNLHLHNSGRLGEPWTFLGVTQSLQVLYMAACPEGSWIDIECKSLSVGRSIAAIHCDMWLKDGKGGKRLYKTCTGTHTKVDNTSTAKI